MRCPTGWQVIEKENADLLIKLIEKADNIDEAIQIAELGTTYKRTGFHFDKRLDKIQTSNTIKYLKKMEKHGSKNRKNIITNIF